MEEKDKSQSRQFLEVEPSKSLLITKKAIKGNPVTTAPKSNVTSKIAPSSLMEQVKSFLPKMKEAERALQKEIETNGPEAVQVDHVGDGQEEKYVEMNIGIVENESDSDWSEDSDPDSPPSPPREGQGNGFTSDSDSDSTISTSSGSSSSGKSSESSPKKRAPSAKRPLIQEVQPEANARPEKRPKT